MGEWKAFLFGTWFLIMVWVTPGHADVGKYCVGSGYDCGDCRVCLCYAETRNICGVADPEGENDDYYECAYINGEPNQMPDYPTYDFDPNWGSQGPDVVISDCGAIDPAKCELNFDVDPIDTWWFCDHEGDPDDSGARDSYDAWAHYIVCLQFNGTIFKVKVDDGGWTSKSPVCVVGASFKKLKISLVGSGCDFFKKTIDEEVTLNYQIFRAVRSTQEIGYYWGGNCIGDYCNENCKYGGAAKFKGELEPYNAEAKKVKVIFKPKNPCED